MIDNTYDLIKAYVEKDPTAFYTYEEFESGVETLRQFCNLRSESISMQLGNGETTENMSYVDASAITLSDMGSMGGSMGGFGGDMPNRPDSMDGPDGLRSNNGQNSQTPDDSDSQPSGLSGTVTNTSSSEGATGNMPDGFDGEMPEGFDPSNMPEGFDPSALPDGFDGNFPGQSSGDQTEATPSEDSGQAGDTDARRPSGGNTQIPSDSPSFNMNTVASHSDFSGWIWIAVSVAILAIGLIVAKKYKG